MFDGKPENQPMQPDPLEVQLAQEWQSAQLAQQHVGDAINKIAEAWRKTRAELSAAQAEVARLNEWVVGLKAERAERDARIAELEARLEAGTLGELAE